MVFRIQRSRRPNPRIRIAGLVAALLACNSCALLNDNFHTVEKGTLYRSGQMADRRLKWIVRRHGVRTVINLRGAHPDESWYREEIAVCEQLRVAHYDLGWTMRAAPEPESLSQLIEWFETVERPILVHCQGGVHRAAVASAAYRLMDGDSTAEARGELGLFFRSAPIGQALAWYENSEKPFAQWVKADYPRLYAENGAGRD